MLSERRSSSRPRGKVGDAPQRNGAPVWDLYTVIREKEFHSSKSCWLRLSMTLNFAEIGCNTWRVDAFAAASTNAPAAIQPGFRRSRQSRMASRETARGAAVAKQTADKAAMPAITKIADGASTQFSSTSTKRQPKAAPSRSTP